MCKLNEINLTMQYSVIYVVIELLRIYTIYRFTNKTLKVAHNIEWFAYFVFACIGGTVCFFIHNPYVQYAINFILLFFILYVYELKLHRKLLIAFTLSAAYTIVQGILGAIFYILHFNFTIQISMITAFVLFAIIIIGEFMHSDKLRKQANIIWFYVMLLLLNSALVIITPFENDITSSFCFIAIILISVLPIFGIDIINKNMQEVLQRNILELHHKNYMKQIEIYQYLQKKKIILLDEMNFIIKSICKSIETRNIAKMNDILNELRYVTPKKDKYEIAILEYYADRCESLGIEFQLDISGNFSQTNTKLNVLISLLMENAINETLKIETRMLTMQVTCKDNKITILVVYSAIQPNSNSLELELIRMITDKLNGMCYNSTQCNRMEISIDLYLK